jgi:hypothetical protein
MKREKHSIYVIDSGIWTPGIPFPGKRITVDLNEKEEIVHIEPDGPHSAGEHGNIVYRILKNHLEMSADVHSIRILDDELNSTPAQLFAALHWVLDVGRPGIVNLSLGLFGEQFRSPMQDLVEKLGGNGIFLVCAASRETSFPSVFDSVISVGDRIIQKDFKSSLAPGIRADFVVDVTIDGNAGKIPSFPSFAAPYVTAKAHAILSRENIGSCGELRAALSEHFERW